MNPGTTASSPRELLVHAGAVWFLADTGTTQARVTGIYRTDGTAGGTLLVATLRAPSELAWLTPWGDRLVYADHDWTYGSEPWSIDAAGRASLLADVRPGTLSSYPGSFAVVGGALFFSASTLVDGATEHVVLRLDAPGGAPVIAAPLPLADGSREYRAIVPYGPGALLVSGLPDAYGYGLWLTDGAPAGTAFLGGGSLQYRDTPAVLGSRVVFRASEPFHYPNSGPYEWYYRNHDLWATDGTPESTVRLAHFCHACDGASGWGAPFPADGYAFFAATDDTHGRELWRTDGTAAGTTLVEDRAPGTGSVSPEFFGRAGDLVFYAVFDGAPTDDPMPDTIAVRAVRIDLADHAPPALACPASLDVEAVDGGGAPVSYVITATDNLTPGVTVSSAPASDTVFPLGVTQVTTSSTDGAGNVGTCTFPVTVADRTAPTVSCPEDQVVEAAGPGGANVEYGDAASTDTVSTPVLAYDRPRGAFALGRTEVVVVATDAAGNAAACTFAVTVRDTTAPSLGCPADLDLEATSAAGAAASWTAPPTDDAVSPVTVTSVPASGATFPLGTTAVAVTAADASGNTSECGFAVRVRDTTAPSVTCPADVHVHASDASGAPVAFDAPSATDAVSPTPALSIDRTSATWFPVGSTRVTATATDAAGNVGTCTFDVVVDAPPPPPRTRTADGCATGVGGPRAAAAILALAALAIRRRRRS